MGETDLERDGDWNRKKTSIEKEKTNPITTRPAWGDIKTFVGILNKVCLERPRLGFPQQLYEKKSGEVKNYPPIAK